MASKAEELKAAGNAAFKAGNFDLALANYSTAIQLDPSVSTYALNRAAVHLKLSNWRDAERDSTTALELDGGANPKALYRRGLARKGLGKLSGAKEDFEEARRQGAGDDVAKELAALVKQLSLSGTQANGAKTNGAAAKPAAASKPLPSPSPVASSSSSPSTERLRAALAPPASSSSSFSQSTKSDGLLTPVSTRRLTPADRFAPSPSPVPSNPPASTSPSKSEPVRTNCFAAKKEARQAREQQPYRAQPPPTSSPSATASSPPPPDPCSESAAAASLASFAPSTAASFLRPPPPPAPRAAASPTSLETHFFSTAPGDPSRLAILRALDSHRMRDWMGDGLTPDLLSAMLGEVLPLFQGDAATDAAQRKRDGELDWVVPLLQGLTECRRWDSAVMFLEEREREGVKRVLDEAQGRIARVRKGWGL
ncbi:hypothetical protein NBRC10512_002945 [Rhodotorula toruloides]|uniref:RNA polymerase II-associated protein 3 n=2 Tax=Rhodotorula toruloides TaxID=5286 RepID=A0A061BHB1_RHOTO|nr:TPR-repeat containing protein [Rhodotorula toruloides NP11]EMS19497.1 TPR-repeat containing protein [Rhodotorula toruloides NP11]CDR48751.1 RHTO0S20e00606g1_1 [Rhodotorula toruloides]